MKQSRPPELRVVIDTQVLLRGAVSKTHSLTSKIYDAWREGRFVLLISEDILQEVEAVLTRPIILNKLELSLIEARAIVQRLRRHANIVQIQKSIRACRDPSDDKFLECAINGKADFIVTADDDLLTLQEFEGIPIVNVSTFWGVIGEK